MSQRAATVWLAAALIFAVLVFTAAFDGTPSETDALQLTAQTALDRNAEQHAINATTVAQKGSK